MTIKTVSAAFIVLSAASVQAATIDTFSGEQLTSDVPISPPPPDFSELVSGSVLGGARDVEAISTLGGPDSVTANVQFGGFSVSNASLGLGSGTLTYDGLDMSSAVSTAGLGGLDITMGINGAFVFDVVTNDLSWAYTIQVWDADSTDTAAGLINPANNGGVLTESLPFSAFSGIDFTSVGALQFVFSGDAGADLSIDNLRTVGDVAPPSQVPLPAGAVLLLTGLGGFAALGRRKRLPS